MTRPDMSIKVERQLHDMRILGRIVGVQSTEQFVWHLLIPTSINDRKNIKKWNIILRISLMQNAENIANISDL